MISNPEIVESLFLHEVTNENITYRNPYLIKTTTTTR